MTPRLLILFGLCYMLAVCKASGTSSVGVVPVGNPGVGKSLILDILLNEKHFEHATRADPVTGGMTSFAKELSGNGQCFSGTFIDLPGIVEVSNENLRKNKEEFDTAMKVAPTQVLLPVFDNANGRPIPLDVYTFNALQRAYEFDKGSVLFVFNSKPEDADANYEHQFVQLVKNGIGWDTKLGGGEMNYIFLDTFSDEEIASFTTAEKVQSNRNKLLAKLLTLVASSHQKKREIEMANEEVARLATEARALQEQNKRLREELRHKLAQQKPKKDLGQKIEHELHNAGKHIGQEMKNAREHVQQEVRNTAKVVEHTVQKAAKKVEKIFCFDPETTVIMKRQNLQKFELIRNIVSGDQVLTVSPESGVPTFTEVFLVGGDLETTVENSVIAFQQEPQGGTGTIHMTKEHLLYNRRNESFSWNLIQAKDVIVGSEVLIGYPKPSSATVKSNQLSVGKGQVYILTEAETFLANGILVSCYHINYSFEAFFSWPLKVLHQWNILPFVPSSVIDMADSILLPFLQLFDNSK